MDAFTMLDAAACILAIAEFGTELLSTSPTIAPQPPPSVDGKDERAILETLEKLKTALSKSKIPPVPEQPSGGVSGPLNNALVLRDLSSSRDVSAALLEDVESALRRPQRRESGTEERLGSRLGGTLCADKLDQLSYAVTRLVISILSSRMSEISQTVEALESERRYTRPEHESRIDTLSHDLEDLKLEVRQRSGNTDAGTLAAFTEADVRRLRDRLVNLAAAEDAMFADRIVSSLNYDSRPVRLDSVPQAHRDTFQWVFDSRLADWFRSGSGTFWIAGKPGSGKSTFMKFVAKHPRTRELLADWAGSSEALAVAAHFFWIAGTPIQKSWQGLLQSLLFDLLRSHPNIISIASPHRWAAAKTGQWQTAAEPWSVSELAAALRALATADRMPLKMCFFIDGLDEYDSNHAELCEVLRDMAHSPRIKICLSSRPWPVFAKSFGGANQESLDIHELTRNDIRNFVNDQLQDHARWTAETSEEAAMEKAELVDRIVAQADGVFLWAFFVTRSLREGLTDGERIGDLKRRFSQLPSDLDQLFQHMLESVAPTDHPKMAGILQAALHALEPLYVDLYWHLERELEGRRPASSRDDREAIEPGLPPEQVSVRREQTIRSIHDKTKGLLRLVDNRVEFLHRTAKDFVLTKDVGEYLRSKLPADHNGFVAIAAAYLGFIRTTRHDHPLVAGIVRQGRGLNTGPFVSHLNQALTYAAEALKQADQQPSSARQRRQAEALLDDYEATVAAMVRRGHVTVSGVNARDCDARLIFREELVRHDVASYLAGRLREQPDYFDIFDESPLFSALMPMARSSGDSPPPVPTVVDLLLLQRCSADPNVRPRQRQPGVADDAASPWVRFARSTMSVFNMLSGPCMFPALRWNASLRDETFSRLMVRGGADPNAPLLADRWGARTVFSHFLDIALSRFLGEECFADYLATLDAFLRAGASLGIPPDNRAGTTAAEGAEMAYGNLGRRRPEESILTSWCTELQRLLPRLAADPPRAQFVSSVAEKLILHCAGREDELRELGSAIEQGCPANIAAPLTQLIASEMSVGPREQGSARKRLPNDDGGSEGSEFKAKHVRRV